MPDPYNIFGIFFSKEQGQEDKFHGEYPITSIKDVLSGMEDQSEMGQIVASLGTTRELKEEITRLHQENDRLRQQILEERSARLRQNEENDRLRQRILEEHSAELPQQPAPNAGIHDHTCEGHGGSGVSRDFRIRD